MQIKSLTIHNFKSIRRMHIPDIENALILVGQNNTGKTTVLDAIRAVGGAYAIRPEDFNEEGANIEIAVSIEYTEDDLRQMQKAGLVSSYHRFEAWKEDFCKKLPSYQDGLLQFTYTANRKGKIRYQDGYAKHNSHIPVHGIADFLQAAVFPEILIDLAGKGIQVQLVQLVVQKPCRLKGIEFHRAFPGNQAHAGEAALAFLGGFKQAAVGTHLLNQPILLQQEQVLL